MNSLPSGSLISYMSSKVKANGGINLAQGIPGFDPPKELLECLRNAAYKKVHQYPPGTGNFRLVDFVVESLKPDFHITQNELLITCGATEALSLLFLYLKQKIKEKFSVLAFDPAYESYSRLPQHFGIPYVSFGNSESVNIDFDHLKQTIISKHVKIMFVSSPGNPHGKIIPKFELDQLCKLSKELNFYLIFDAVYKELYVQEMAYQPFEHFGPNLFYVNSFSKLLSITGWRIGYLIADSSHMPDIRSMHDYTGLCVPSVLQEALVDYLDDFNGGMEYIKNLRQNISHCYQQMVSNLQNIGFIIPNIDGGYFIWAKLPPFFQSGFDFAEQLYNKEKIAVVPGIHFSENAQNYIRLNIARPETELKEARIGIERFIHQSI